MANNAQYSQIIRCTYDQLLRYIDLSHPDSLIRAIQTLLPEQDPTEVRETVSRIDAGLAYGRSLAESGLLKESATVESVLDNLTASMTPQEKKGLYLILYESFRESDSLFSGDAAKAPHDYELFPGLTPEDLQNIVLRQMEFHAQDILSSIADSPDAGSAFQDLRPDPRVLCAAYYVAGSTGDIPHCFSQIPEFSGICTQLTQSTDGLSPEERARLLHIIIAAALAIAVIIAVTNGVMPSICTYLLSLIEKSAFHETMKLILSSLVKNSLPHITAMLAGTFSFIAARNELDKAYNNLIAPVESEIGQSEDPVLKNQPVTPEIFA